MFGFLNIDKPQGITAHDVVAAVRRAIGIKQVGHAGTLDPMATGVLPIAVGKATRLIRFLDSDKTYLAQIKFGQQTDTDDITGKTVSESPEVPTSHDIVAFALTGFNGTQIQIPPMYSAVHVQGRRLYEMARKGEAPDTIPQRTITVYSIELISYEQPVATVRIHCSAGTYIRSIARDLGQQLGCGACLSGLVREQAGKFRLPNAINLDQLNSAKGDGTAASFVVPADQALSLFQVSLNREQALHLTQGKTVLLEETAELDRTADYILAMHSQQIVSVCKVIQDDGNAFVRIKPEVVLQDAIQLNH